MTALVSGRAHGKVLINYELLNKLARKYPGGLIPIDMVNLEVTRIVPGEPLADQFRKETVTKITEFVLTVDV